MRTVLLAISISVGALSSAATAQQVAAPQPAAAQPAPDYGTPVTLDVARRAVEAAKTAARGRKFAMSLVVVDPNGDLILFEKMDGAANSSIDIAHAKARTAALFKRPTKTFSDAVAAGRLTFLNVPNMIAIEGGLPIIVGGRVIGGFGVSGAAAEQDAEVAAAGLAALKG